MDFKTPVNITESGDVMDVIASVKKSKIRPKRNGAFDLCVFLDSAGVSRRVVHYRRLQNIYSQGDPATSVRYIQTGAVRLSVVNASGKEAVVAVLGPAISLARDVWQGRRFVWGRPPQLYQRFY
jgi:Cyclic nucleotide-binding domain